MNISERQTRFQKHYYVWNSFYIIIPNVQLMIRKNRNNGPKLPNRNTQLQHDSNLIKLTSQKQKFCFKFCRQQHSEKKERTPIFPILVCLGLKIRKSTLVGSIRVNGIFYCCPFGPKSKGKVVPFFKDIYSCYDTFEKSLFDAFCDCVFLKAF